MKRYYLIFFFFLVILFGCQTNTSNQNEPTSWDGIPVELKYAKGFSITQYEGFDIVEVKEPWKGTEASFTYLLKDKNTTRPHGFDDAIVVDVPVESMACLSTTYVGALDMLGSTDCISAIANSQWIYNEKVQASLANGKTANIGSDANLDYEQLVFAEPQIVMAYGIDEQFMTSYNKLKELGLLTVVNAEYMEDTPLGQAEWIKFMAVFTNQVELADSLFNYIDNEYVKYKSLVKDKVIKPTVFFNFPWKGTWYMPSGESYAAQFVNDAGGEYLWSDETGKTSVVLDYEVIYAKAYNADFWLNPGAYESTESMETSLNNCADFDAFMSENVFNNNARINKNGGNDYWESGTVNPHLILADLIKILHPDLLPEHQLVYYKQIE